MGIRVGKQALGWGISPVSLPPQLRHWFCILIVDNFTGSEKLDVEGTDLLELLSHLEGELQARDIAIAALKSEQLKRVLYGLHRVVANSAERTSGDPSSHLEASIFSK